MDLRSWIVNDLASARQRLAGGILGCIPTDRLDEQADGGGIAPLYVLWHMTRHHDLAINGVLRGRDEVVHDWTDRLGVSDELWRGLSEGSDTDLVQILDPDAVAGYSLAALDGTIEWLNTAATFDNLDSVPPSSETLSAIGTPPADFDWLYSMWAGKPRYWFLSWEGHGHVVTHTGELVSIRNRMGFSPF
ncbi:MAG: hypothetical protein ACC660_04465 [Acidimicrobiales bacterium]